MPAGTELHHSQTFVVSTPRRMHRNCLGQYDGAVRSARLVEDGLPVTVDMLWIGECIDLDDSPGRL